ncbi:GNAT family N-acetyltransferase [Desulfosporosinus sp. SYSU MS00001]|uniref:GNAT family N-acetyltransferase n=1 Tax=Desulfosporosinus sp. SYSU MS00001 TaxID=3416284 RepID=UPI003CF5D487
MLKGKFVGLRAIERQDLAQLQEWRNRPEYRRYFREYREIGMDAQNIWYEKKVLQDPNIRMFSIVELATDRLLGACGLCYIDWVNRTADFSIYIGADNLYIDSMFAPDSGKVLLDYGFDELGLHRIWAEIYDFDESKKVLFKTLGFKLDGRHRETHWAEGKWNDSLFYGYLSTER